MRFAVIGAFVGLGLICLAKGGSWGQGTAEAAAPRAATSSESGRLIAFAESLVEGQRQVVVIDALEKVIGVYHVSQDGEIQLKSVRKIEWDLKIEEFNSVGPAPSEVRAQVDGLEQARIGSERH